MANGIGFLQEEIASLKRRSKTKDKDLVHYAETIDRLNHKIERIREVTSSLEPPRKPYGGGTHSEEYLKGYAEAIKEIKRSLKG